MMLTRKNLPFGLLTDGTKLRNNWPAMRTGLDRETKKISYGRIPAGSVVIAGTLPSADGSYSTACAVIIKKDDAQSRVKASITALLRE